MVAVNGDQGTLAGHDPNHDDDLVVVHDVPMAYHVRPGARARVDKETSVHSTRQGQLADDWKGDTAGTQVLGNGHEVGVEAKQTWMARA
jgi:hypothetical protein